MLNSHGGGAECYTQSHQKWSPDCLLHGPQHSTWYGQWVKGACSAVRWVAVLIWLGLGLMTVQGTPIIMPYAPLSQWHRVRVVERAIVVLGAGLRGQNSRACCHLLYRYCGWMVRLKGDFPLRPMPMLVLVILEPFQYICGNWKCYSFWDPEHCESVNWPGDRFEHFYSLESPVHIFLGLLGLIHSPPNKISSVVFSGFGDDHSHRRHGALPGNNW